MRGSKSQRTVTQHLLSCMTGCLKSERTRKNECDVLHLHHLHTIIEVVLCKVQVLNN